VSLSQELVSEFARSAGDISELPSMKFPAHVHAPPRAAGLEAGGGGEVSSDQK
jgi:hypothetical protein